MKICDLLTEFIKKTLVKFQWLSLVASQSFARFHWLTVETDSKISLVHWGDWHSPVRFHWLIHYWLSVSPPPGLWPPSTRGSPSGSWSADSWFCAASSYTSGDRSVLPHCRSLFHPRSLCRYFQFDQCQIDLKYIHRYMKWNSIDTWVFSRHSCFLPHQWPYRANIRANDRH